MSDDTKSAPSPANRFLRLYLEALELNHRRPAERDALLRQLARDDDRYRAVLALLLDDKQGYVQAIATQELAEHHGCLEHCAGSLYAIDLLLGNLEAALQPPPTRPKTEEA